MNPHKSSSEHVGIRVFNATRIRGARTTPTDSLSRTKLSPSPTTGTIENSRQRATSSVLDSVSVKTCAVCEEDKPASAFFPTRGSPDGLTARCKKCILASARRDRAERERRGTGGRHG